MQGLTPESGADHGTVYVPSDTSPVALALLICLSVSVAALATTEYGWVLPIALLAVPFLWWSCSSAMIAVPLIIVLNLHLLEPSEGISIVEVAFGVYFFGYVGYWFLRRSVFLGEKIARDRADALLLTFLSLCAGSVVVVAVVGGRLVDWLREFLTISHLLLYFPAREVMKTRRGVRVVAAAILVVTGTVAILSLYNYNVATAAAVYLWELVGGRQSFGDHYFFPMTVFALALLTCSHTMRSHILLGGLFTLYSVSLAITFSRGFWIAAAAGALVLFLLGGGKERWRMGSIVALSAGAALVLSTILLGNLAGPIADALAVRLTSAGLRDLSLLERLGESRAVLDLFLASPVIGHGIGASFMHYDIILKTTTESTFVHNGYLFLLFKVGLVGTAVFLGFFMYVLFQAVSLLRMRASTDWVDTAILRGAIAVLAGMALVTITSNVFVTKQSLLILSLSAAFIMGQRDRISETPASSTVSTWQ